MSDVADKFVISDELKREIDHWLSKFPPNQKRSAVIPSLLLIQQQNNGWLDLPAMNALAEYLEMPNIEVYEVVSFYDMYNQHPVGKHKIGICTNVSCMLRGSDELVTVCREKLGIELGETSSDGKFTLHEMECLAACGGAPMCQVDDKDYHENLTPQKMAELIDHLAQES